MSFDFFFGVFVFPDERVMPIDPFITFSVKAFDVLEHGVGVIPNPRVLR